jgi:hypothetical protein
LEIEQGSEVFIPKQLNQKDLPHSMRFYDPLINIVRVGMDDVRKGFFFLKNKMQKETLMK